MIYLGNICRDTPVKTSIRQFSSRVAAVSLLLAGLYAGTSAALAGDKLSWFGETSFIGAYPDGLPGMTTGPQIDIRTGEVNIGARLLQRQLDLDTVFSNGDPLTDKINQFHSEVGFKVGEEVFSFPLYYRSTQYNNGNNQKLDSFGLKWRHRFENAGSLTVSARYGKGASILADESLKDTANKLASVSWTSGLERSGLTGSLYFGDEQISDTQVNEENGYRVYGFAVGGHWSLIGHHTPYVSLRYQTTDQEVMTGLTDYDRYTRISAGWNWQVQPNWQIRAEANFTYDQPRWNLLNVDRARVLFSTRFDIK